MKKHEKQKIQIVKVSEFHRLDDMADRFRQLRIEKARAILNHKAFLAKSPYQQQAFINSLIAGGLHPDDLAFLQREILDAEQTNADEAIASLERDPSFLVMESDPLFLVMENLDASSIVKLCSTNHRFSTFCKKNTDAIWNYLLQRDYPDKREPFTAFLKSLYQNKGPYEYYRYLSLPPKTVSISETVRTQLANTTGSSKTNTRIDFNATAARIVADANTYLVPHLDRIYPPIFPGDTIMLSPLRDRVLLWNGKQLSVVSRTSSSQNGHSQNSNVVQGVIQDAVPDAWP